MMERPCNYRVRGDLLCAPLTAEAAAAGGLDLPLRLIEVQPAPWEHVTLLPSAVALLEQAGLQPQSLQGLSVTTGVRVLDERGCSSFTPDNGNQHARPAWHLPLAQLCERLSDLAIARQAPAQKSPPTPNAADVDELALEELIAPLGGRFVALHACYRRNGSAGNDDFAGQQLLFCMAHSATLAWLTPLADGHLAVTISGPSGELFGDREEVSDAVEDALVACPGLLERLVDATLVGDLTASGCGPVRPKSKGVCWSYPLDPLTLACALTTAHRAGQLLAFACREHASARFSLAAHGHIFTELWSAFHALRGWLHSEKFSVERLTALSPDDRRALGSLFDGDFSSEAGATLLAQLTSRSSPTAAAETLSEQPVRRR